MKPTIVPTCFFFSPVKFTFVLPILMMLEKMTLNEFQLKFNSKKKNLKNCRSNRILKLKRNFARES